MEGLAGHILRPLAIAAGMVLTGGCGGSDDEPWPSPGRVNALIRSDTYPRLVIELDHVEGLAPRSDALEGTAGVLYGVLDKPGGIEFVHDQVLEPYGSDKRWTEQEVFELAERHGNLPLEEDTVGIHIVVVDGVYASNVDADTTTIGLAWGGTSIVLFMEPIRSICEGAGLPWRVQEDLCRVTDQSVVLHEIGHLLGLVNHGLPMQADHEDTEHAHHCADQDCVMYWCYERVHAIEALRDRFMAGDTEIGTFGGSCVDDITAVRDASTGLASSAAIDASVPDAPDRPYACRLPEATH